MRLAAGWAGKKSPSWMIRGTIQAARARWVQHPRAPSPTLAQYNSYQAEISETRGGKRPRNRRQPAALHSTARGSGWRTQLRGSTEVAGAGAGEAGSWAAGSTYRHCAPPVRKLAQSRAGARRTTHPADTWPTGIQPAYTRQEASTRRGAREARTRPRRTGRTRCSGPRCRCCCCYCTAASSAAPQLTSITTTAVPPASSEVACRPRRRMACCCPCSV
jgi:hypothetical protein